MTDRERLDKMAKEAEEHRAKEKAGQERKEAEVHQAEQDRAAENKRMTEELRVYCEQTFSGFKLNPTGHEVAVSTTAMSKLHDIQSDGGEYVSLTITHWGDETGGFQGQIPILLCRYHKTPHAAYGMYELYVGVGGKQLHGPNLDAFKEDLLRAVASMGSEQVGAIFKQVKNRLTR